MNKKYFIAGERKHNSLQPKRQEKKMGLFHSKPYWKVCPGRLKEAMFCKQGSLILTR